MRQLNVTRMGHSLIPLWFVCLLLAAQLTGKIWEEAGRYAG